MTDRKATDDSYDIPKSSHDQGAADLQDPFNFG
jgi:hypothetical protein